MRALGALNYFEFFREKFVVFSFNLNLRETIGEFRLLIIFINRIFLSPRKNYRFHFV